MFQQAHKMYVRMPLLDGCNFIEDFHFEFSYCIAGKIINLLCL